MAVNKAEFITSAAKSADFIVSEKPIVAVAGKSNVGKSSFINALAGRSVARTSNSPGRTRLVNYFDFGDFLLADLPGYGYAAVSKAEKEKWGVLMEAFFAETRVAHVLSLVDIRHSPTADDKKMAEFLYTSALPFTFIATKSDKLGKSRIKPRVAELAAQLGVAAANVIATSSADGRGREETLCLLERIVALHKRADNFIDPE